MASPLFHRGPQIGPGAYVNWGWCLDRGWTGQITVPQDFCIRQVSQLGMVREACAKDGDIWCLVLRLVGLHVDAWLTIARLLSKKPSFLSTQRLVNGEELFKQSLKLDFN